MGKCDVGLIGLAVMGENLVLNMEKHGYSVAVYNRTVKKKVDGFLEGNDLHESGEEANSSKEVYGHEKLDLFRLNLFRV